MNIKIYGKESCSKCKTVANRLEDKNIEFKYITGEETIEKARELGITQAPICIVDGEYKSYINMINIIKERSK